MENRKEVWDFIRLVTGVASILGVPAFFSTFLLDDAPRSDGNTEIEEEKTLHIVLLHHTIDITPYINCFIPQFYLYFL